MASMLRKLGLSSRESSQERNTPRKDSMKLEMERSPLFARRMSPPEHPVGRPDQPLPDVLHGSDVQRSRAQKTGLSLDLHNALPQPSYSASGTYEHVQPRNRGSDMSYRQGTSSSFARDGGRKNVDSCLSPLTPVTPLSPNSLGSPFLPRHNARPIAFATPQLSRKASNTVVFDNAQSMVENNVVIDDSAIAFEVLHSPRKVVARSISSTPHPPVTPTEYTLPRTFSTESSDPTRSDSGSLSSLSHYEDLSISGVSALSRSDSIDRDSDHTYQTVNKSNRSSRTGSSSSLYVSPVQTSDEKRKTSTSRPPNLPTGLPTRKDSSRSLSYRSGTTPQHPQSTSRTSGPPYHPHPNPSQSDSTTLSEDLANLRYPINSWSDRNTKRFTQFVSRNSAALSMLPQEEIVKLFREQFTMHINFEETLHEEPPNFVPPPLNESPAKGMSVESMVCTRCGDGFEPQEKIVNSNGQLWHTQCFVCAQCFRAFPDDIFYEFEGRRYCEHDFQVLFAPCCAHCNEFIIGRVIKAMNCNWHPQCFRCNECHKELADLGFIRYMGRAVCHDCNARLKAQSLSHYMCYKCHSVIDGEPLRWRGDTYHPYHFNCANCDAELTHQAREVKSRPGYTANQMNQLYCLRCHDKMGIPICGACRRPIEERVVTALGKHWHVEHFVCIKCEKPFYGNRHYEKKGQAYCETHYHELFGNLCFVCNQVIYGDVVTALNKAWCMHHFACSLCDLKMTQKTKFFEFDQKPICKKCYEKLPQELKKRLKRHHDTQARGGKPAAV